MDIRKAYVDGVPSGRLYVRLPPEPGLGNDVVARLDSCMYGTRNAGANWETCYTSALLSMGFAHWVASPCCFIHKDKGVQVVIRGDDFTALGTDVGLDWYEHALAEHFELKLKGRLGHDDQDMTDMRVLNRLLGVTDKGLLDEPIRATLNYWRTRWASTLTTCQSHL